MTKNNELKLVEERNITDSVLNRVMQMQTEGSLDLPSKYSAGNALKSAFLILQETQTSGKKPVLEACTKESIINALLDMVVSGLNPAKQQGYFIPYGNQLKWSRSYLGTIALTKRIKGVEDVKGYAIYEGDELEFGFDYMKGKTTIESYKPSINRDPDKLIGAMALIIGKDEILHVEYMDMEQIRKAWNQGSMKGGSGAHKNFPDQMAIKTVINRGCKTYAQTSEDEVVSSLMNSMSETDREVEAELETNANKISLDDAIIDEETGEVIMKEEQIEGQESMPF